VKATKYKLDGLSYGETKHVFVLMIGDLIHFAYTKGFEMGFPGWGRKNQGRLKPLFRGIMG